MRVRVRESERVRVRESERVRVRESESENESDYNQHQQFHKLILLMHSQLIKFYLSRREDIDDHFFKWVPVGEETMMVMMTMIINYERLKTLRERGG